MPTATSNYSRRVLFDPDGEALDFTDTNNMQLFSRMREQSLLLGGALANIAGDPSNPGTSLTRPDEIGLVVRELPFNYADFVLVPFGGAAFAVATGAARTLALAPGPFMQIIDEPWNGGGEEMATFEVPAGYGLTLQTAVGDATHPRIDLYEVKLEYVDGDTQSRHFEDAVTRAPSSQNTEKERRVQLTYQVKQGTPAASPAYPAPSSGFVPIAAVYVPAGHNAVHSPDNIRDMRMPLGVRAYDVPYTAFSKTGADPWEELNGAILSTGLNSDLSDYVYADCPIGSAGARLLGVGIHGSPGDDYDAVLIRRTYPASNAVATDATLAVVSDDGVFADDGFTYVDMVTLMDRIDAAGTHKGTRVADTFFGTPLWCNGKTSGPGDPFAGSVLVGAMSRLALRFASQGTGISGPGARASFVRFWIAEGL